MPSYLNPNVVKLDAIQDLAFQPLDEEFAFKSVDFAITNYGTLKDFSIIVNNFEQTQVNVDIDYTESVIFDDDRIKNTDGNYTISFDVSGQTLGNSGETSYPLDNSGNRCYIPYFYTKKVDKEIDGANHLPDEINFGTTDTVEYTKIDNSGNVIEITTQTIDRTGVDGKFNYNMDLFNNNFLLVKDPKRLLRGVIYNIFVLEIFDQIPNISNIDFTQESLRNNGLFFVNDPTGDVDGSGTLNDNVKNRTKSELTGIKTETEIFDYWFKQSTIWHRDYAIVQEEQSGIINFGFGDILYILYNLKLTVSRPSSVASGDATLSSALGKNASGDIQRGKLVSKITDSVPITEKNVSFILGWRVEPRTVFTVTVSYYLGYQDTDAEGGLLSKLETLYESTGIGRQNVIQIITEFISTIYKISYESINLNSITFSSLQFDFDVMTPNVIRDEADGTVGEPRDFTPTDATGPPADSLDLAQTLLDAVKKRGLPNESFVNIFPTSDGSVEEVFFDSSGDIKYKTTDLQDASGVTASYTSTELIIEPEPEPEPQPEPEPEPEQEPEPEPENPYDISYPEMLSATQLPHWVFSDSAPPYYDNNGFTVHPINRTDWPSDVGDDASGNMDFTIFLSFEVDVTVSAHATPLFIPNSGEILDITVPEVATIYEINTREDDTGISNGYIFDGILRDPDNLMILGGNPSMNINYGDTLVIKEIPSGHPIKIYKEGSSGSGSDIESAGSGDITFIPNATGTYIYECQTPGHSANMNGRIIVSAMGEQTLINVSASTKQNIVISSSVPGFGDPKNIQVGTASESNSDIVTSGLLYDSNSKYFLCITNNSNEASFALYERNSGGVVTMLHTDGDADTIKTTPSLSSDPRNETMNVTINSTVLHSTPPVGGVDKNYYGYSIGMNFDYLKFEMHFDDVGTENFENYVENAKF